MKYFDDLNQQFGQAIRDSVVKDLSKGRQPGPSGLGLFVKAVAFLILLTPYLVAAFGAIMIVFNRDSISAMIIGALFVAAGYYLSPRRVKNTQDTLRPPEAPTFFALLDDISAHLQAPKIRGAHTTADFNAYMASFGKSDHVIGIGAPFWKAMDGPERLAVLAHEVAHLINKDPARSKLYARAFETLGRWYDLTHPPAIIDHANNTSYYYEDRGLVGQAVSALFGNFIAFLAISFEKLIFADSQRAEYLADVAATRISGIEAYDKTMKLAILAPLSAEALSQVHFDGTQDISVFALMATAIREPDTTKAENLYAQAIKDRLSIDSTHPPTRFRMEVIAAVGTSQPKITANDIDWVAIDQELSHGFHRQEQRLLDQIIAQ